MEVTTLKQKNNIPSIITFSIVGLILFCSYEGRSIFKVIVEQIGRKPIEWIIIIAISISAFKLEVHKNWKQFLITGVLALLAYYFFAAEELLHVLFFGSLGASVQHDIKSGKNKKTLILFGAGVCIGDEIFQAFLPWRFGDLRDVVLNLASFTFAFIVCKGILK